MKNLAVSLFLVLLVGCATLFSVTVTLTETVDSAAKEYVKLFKAGLVSSETDKKVEEAHLKYRQMVGVAVEALKAYKASGDSTQYNLAFATAVNAASEFVRLLYPLFDAKKTSEIQGKMKKVSQL